MSNDTLIKQGYGLPHIHLGQFADEVSGRFGAARKVRKSSALRTYWLYPDAGFDCIISSKSKRVLSIFFHAQNGGRLQEIQVVCQKAVTFHATESEVRGAFGPPDKVGGDFTTGGGEYVPKWLSYPSGIGFYFGKDGGVETIGVFRPSRLRKPEDRHDVTPV